MMRVDRRTVLAGMAAAALPGDGLFDAQGFRAGRYRAVVDRDPAPARRIAVEAALTLTPGRDARFIDVLPAEGARRGAGGAWVLAEPHDSIPGALWFPETGRAPVDPVLWRRLVATLQRDRGPVVVFCRADCWMSWNAARRLALGGMADVWWLAEGIDGWHDAGRALIPAKPY